jgi:hypothetical protein
MVQKYNLKCVNKGKPFVMPNWTPEKHEKALAKLVEAQKENKWTDVEANKQFKFFVVHETLLELDPDCKFEDIPRHPATIVELFNAVYNAGREDIYYKEENFRKKGKTQKDKK